MRANTDARICPSQVSGPGSTGSGPGCGQSTLGSLGRFDPGSYSLRMSQGCLLTNQQDEYSATFPRWGSMRSGEVFERPTWAPRTDGSGRSFWPTPAQRDYKGGNNASYQERSGTTKGEQLPNFVRHHFRPDPTASTLGGKSSPSDRTLNHRFQAKRLNVRFVEWLMNWPTGWTEV